MDIQNVFGESFERFLIESAVLVDQLQSKEKRTKQEEAFIQAFEEIGEVIISPEFQKLKKKE